MDYNMSSHADTQPSQDWAAFLPPKNILSEKQCFSRIGGALVALLASTLIVQFAAAFLCSMIAPDLLNDNNVNTGIAMISMYCCGFPVAALLLRRVPSAALPRRSLTPHVFFTCLLISIAFMDFGNLLGEFTMAGIDQLLGTHNSNDINTLAETTSPLIWTLCVVFAAPFFEEFLFRKILIDRVHPFGDRFAMLFSGLVFGLFHGNLYQFFYAAFIGVVLAYLYLRTGQLRWSILLHTCINCIGGLLPVLLDSLPDFFLILYSLMLLLCAAAGLILLIRSRHFYDLKPPICPLSHGIRTVICNPGMLLFFLVIVCEFLSDIFW